MIDNDVMTPLWRQIGNMLDDVILLLQIESFVVLFFFLCKLGILLFKPRWDYKIWKKKGKEFWSR